MLAMALASHADRLRTLGQPLLAEGELRRALELCTAEHGAEHAQSVELLAKLAQVEFAVGNPLALETAERALAAMDRVLGAEQTFVRATAPLLRSMIHLAAPERAVDEEAQPSLFAFYELEIGRGIQALEAKDPQRAVDILTPLAEQAHNMGIATLEATAACLLAQGLAMIGQIGAAVLCAQRSVDLAVELGQPEVEKRFRALLDVLKAEEEHARNPDGSSEDEGSGETPAEDDDAAAASPEGER